MNRHLRMKSIGGSFGRAEIFNNLGKCVMSYLVREGIFKV